MWTTATLISAARGNVSQNQNPNNVYATCQLTDDSTPPQTMTVYTWANDLSPDSLGAWLKAVIAASNAADTALASLQATVGQVVTLPPDPTPDQSTTTLPTIQSVVQLGSVISAYTALIAAGVIDDSDAGYTQAVSDAKVAAQAQSQAVASISQRISAPTLSVQP